MVPAVGKLTAEVLAASACPTNVVVKQALSFAKISVETFIEGASFFSVLLLQEPSNTAGMSHKIKFEHLMSLLFLGAKFSIFHYSLVS